MDSNDQIILIDMALDFGDAGLFDPIPTTNNKHKSKKDEDDENDNVHGNGWNNDDDHEKDKLDPEDDEPDDEDLEEDWPTAPPLDILDCIKGYEMVSFDATSVPPPPFEEVVEEEVEVIDGADGGDEKKGEDEGGENDDGIKPKVGKVVPLTSIQSCKGGDRGHRMVHGGTVALTVG